MSPTTSMEKTCPRCGKSFSCTQAAGCWCEAVQLDAAIRADLRARFVNCLCEACLRAAVAPPAA